MLKTNSSEPDKPRISGSIGGLTTRLAQSKEEVEQAQKIRFKVFYEELSATQTDKTNTLKKDADAFDEQCDHLLVLDTNQKPNPSIIGTQRFFISDAKTDASKFYSSSEFEIGPLLKRHANKRFMELGRSCILPEYRSKRTMELLWHGTWDYALKRNADVMFGCASFQTNRPEEIMDQLNFLASLYPEENEWDVSSNNPNAISMDSKEIDATETRKIVRKLPPLIKGYLRLGGRFSKLAVPDPDFGTIDVLVMVPIAHINPKYVSHYGKNAERHKNI